MTERCIYKLSYRAFTFYGPPFEANSDRLRWCTIRAPKTTIRRPARERRFQAWALPTSFAIT